MAATYRIAHIARADLDDIWNYIGQDNPEAADRLMQKFRKQFEDIAEFPEMGRASETIGAGLRRLPVENYLILYRVTSDCVEISRVLHGARDIESLF